MRRQKLPVTIAVDVRIGKNCRPIVGAAQHKVDIILCYQWAGLKVGVAWFWHVFACLTLRIAAATKGLGIQSVEGVHVHP